MTMFHIYFKWGSIIDCVFRPRRPQINFFKKRTKIKTYIKTLRKKECSRRNGVDYRSWKINLTKLKTNFIFKNNRNPRMQKVLNYKRVYVAYNTQSMLISAYCQGKETCITFTTALLYWKGFHMAGWALA